MAGHTAIVKLLARDKRAKVDEPNIWGQTPLMIASELGHEVVVHRKDVSLNFKNHEFERTALGWAAQRGSAAIVRLLLQRAKSRPIQEMTGFNPSELYLSYRKL